MEEVGAFSDLHGPRGWLPFLDMCVTWVANYPRRAMCAEFGAGEKTTDRRRKCHHAMTRLYTNRPGLSTVGDQRDNAPVGVEIEETPPP